VQLSRSGVFEAFFQALAGLSKTAHLVQMFDRCSTDGVSRPAEGHR
jgi:hypothetical protein